MTNFHSVINVLFWSLWVWIYIPRKCTETVLHYVRNIGYFISYLVAITTKLIITYPRKCGETAMQSVCKWSNCLLQYPVETLRQCSWWRGRHLGRIFSGKLIVQFTETIREKFKQLLSALWWRIHALVIVTLNSVWTLIKVVLVLQDTLPLQLLPIVGVLTVKQNIMSWLSYVSFVMKSFFFVFSFYEKIWHQKLTLKQMLA